VAHLVQGLGKLIVRIQCTVHQQMIRWSRNLGRISKCENGSFQMVTEINYAIWWCSESEFQRVRTATEKTWVPTGDLTLGTDNNWKPDERSSLDLGVKRKHGKQI